MVSCNKNEKAAFADALYRRRKLTLAELRRTSKNGLGYELIKSPLNVPLPPNVTPDVKIISFSYIGKAPMVGYREDRTFNVLWIDPKFRVYDHGSK